MARPVREWDLPAPLRKTWRAAQRQGGIVRRIVEKHEPRSDRIAEVDDIQTGGRLIEAIAISPSVDAEQATEQQADRCLVRDDQHLSALVRSGNRREARPRPR